MENISSEQRMKSEREAGISEKMYDEYVKLGWICKDEKCPCCHEDGHIVNSPEHQKYCLKCRYIFTN